MAPAFTNGTSNFHPIEQCHRYARELLLCFSTLPLRGPARTRRTAQVPDDRRSSRKEKLHKKSRIDRPFRHVVSAFAESRDSLVPAKGRLCGMARGNAQFVALYQEKGRFSIDTTKVRNVGYRENSAQSQEGSSIYDG